MRHAHRLGMSTTATMMYGHVETLAERVEHMRRIRDLQDEMHGFRAFISWTFQPDNTRLGKQVKETPTSFDYLLTQAVSRIYLDNVDHIQSSWVTQGMKIGQVALDFGADDMGSIMIEENVVSAAGTDLLRRRRRLLPPDPRGRQAARAARHPTVASRKHLMWCTLRGQIPSAACIGRAGEAVASRSRRSSRAGSPSCRRPSSPVPRCA